LREWPGASYRSDGAVHTTYSRSSAEQQFSLEGDLPVGTANGSVVVDSPQLETPVTMNFEVHTRRSLAWLFMVAAFGLAIGALTRTWLKSRIALQDAKARAAELLTTIDRELSQRPDRDFRLNMRAATGIREPRTRPARLGTIEPSSGALGVTARLLGGALVADATT